MWQETKTREGIDMFTSSNWQFFTFHFIYTFGEYKNKDTDSGTSSKFMMSQIQGHKEDKQTQWRIKNTCKSNVWVVKSNEANLSKNQGGLWRRKQFFELIFKISVIMSSLKYLSPKLKVHSTDYWCMFLNCRELWESEYHLTVFGDMSIMCSTSCPI